MIALCVAVQMELEHKEWQENQQQQMSPAS